MYYANKRIKLLCEQHFTALTDLQKSGVKIHHKKSDTPQELENLKLGRWSEHLGDGETSIKNITSMQPEHISAVIGHLKNIRPSNLTLLKASWLDIFSKYQAYKRKIDMANIQVFGDIYKTVDNDGVLEGYYYNQQTIQGRVPKRLPFMTAQELRMLASDVEQERLQEAKREALAKLTAFEQKLLGV